MTRVVSCLRQISAKDAEVLDLEMCSSTRRPKSKMRCSEAPCPPRWEVDDWSEVGDVTYACVIWRIVCHFTLLFGRLLLLTFIYVVFPRPWSDLIIQEWARFCILCRLSFRVIRTLRSYVNYQNDCASRGLIDYSRGVRFCLKCRPSCGEGFRSRNVFCVTSDNHRTLHHLCDAGVMPSGHEKCSTTICPAPRWEFGSWGEVSH